MRVSTDIGMKSEREYKPIVLAMKVGKMFLPQFERYIRIDKSMRVGMSLDKHVRRQIVEGP